MIWNYDEFSRQKNTKSGKICALSKICIFLNLIVKKKKTYWGNYIYIYIKFQKKSFENSSLGKHFFEKKGPQKGH
jgi:hypothetical protein